MMKVNSSNLKAVLQTFASYPYCLLPIVTSVPVKLHTWKLYFMHKEYDKPVYLCSFVKTYQAFKYGQNGFYQNLW